MELKEVQLKFFDMSDLIKCPKCQSTQVTANKKGFSGTKALAGAAVAGGVGILAGTLGSNKVEITCLNCGKQFKPGEDYDNKKKQEAVLNSKPGMIAQAIVGLVLVVLFVWFVQSCG
tara:strand:+ start:198 stop:548 length:351 start_codon:yes stop_codon:yes gene_type:complete